MEALETSGATPLRSLVEHEIARSDRPAGLARSREMVVEPRWRGEAEGRRQHVIVDVSLREQHAVAQRAGQRVPVRRWEEVEIVDANPAHRFLVERHERRQVGWAQLDSHRSSMSEGFSAGASMV